MLVGRVLPGQCTLFIAAGVIATTECRNWRERVSLANLLLLLRFCCSSCRQMLSPVFLITTRHALVGAFDYSSVGHMCPADLLFGYSGTLAAAHYFGCNWTIVALASRVPAGHVCTRQCVLAHYVVLGT